MFLYHGAVNSHHSFNEYSVSYSIHIIPMISVSYGMMYHSNIIKDICIIQHSRSCCIIIMHMWYIKWDLLMSPPTLKIMDDMLCSSFVAFNMNIHIMAMIQNTHKPFHYLIQMISISWVSVISVSYSMCIIAIIPVISVSHHSNILKDIYDAHLFSITAIKQLISVSYRIKYHRKFIVPWFALQF